jgi:altronate dehydratase large subunit
LKFLGYPRVDGSVGTRSYIGIIPSIFCANRVAKCVGDNTSNSVVLAHNLGCGQHGADLEQTITTLTGLGRHPNLAAVLVVSLGCEKLSPQELSRSIGKSGKPLEIISIQECGGTSNAIKEGTKIVSGWASTLFSQKREEVDISNLVVSLKCGGTDATSGIASNPALGFASDMIVNNGGTAIISELTELIGAEHVLAIRAKDSRIAKEILMVVGKAETSLREKTKGINRVCSQGALVSTGNYDGGISSVAEKALGGMYKSGTAPFSGVVGYAEKPSGKGLYLMVSPGVDNEAVTGMVAGGANIVVFTTGRGTPSGFPFVPVIKVTGNSNTYKRMTENMDINAGSIIDGEKTLDEVGKEIFKEIINVASGKPTKAEILKHDELFSINRLF